MGDHRCSSLQPCHIRQALQAVLESSGTGPFAIPVPSRDKTCSDSATITEHRSIREFHDMEFQSLDTAGHRHVFDIL